jgi:tetratricopeptide (TPR) repeat protein
MMAEAAQARARALIVLAGLASLCAPGAAQAEESPSAHHAAHAPATPAQWAAGAQLFDGLGSFHRGITTSAPLAQQYFDQGMRLLWAFNHDEATRSFAEAARLDPSCASCYWGVALSVGPNYNFQRMDHARAQVAWEALHEAQQNAAHASAVEQSLIDALKSRYPSSEPLGANNLAAVLEAYAAAMRAVAARYPEDLDVQTLCAEAQMNVHAWKLWNADGTPVAGTLETEARLEEVLRRDPGHPGANHYYIHVMEASPHPERALEAAERLREMMPAAGHLQHMPAHIMQRVGRYEEAAEANRRGVAADRAYLAATTPPEYYEMYLRHNYGFLAYAAAMEGRKAESLAAVQDLLEMDSMRLMRQMGSSGWGMSSQYAVLVRFGLWDELLALDPPDPKAPGLTAGYLYGRGVALASRGRIADAREALEQLRAFNAALPPQDDFLRQMVRIAEPIVAARIAASEARNDEAVALLTQAVAAEDGTDYAEPADWFFPVRHLLGAQLLIEGHAEQAEAVYREDLKRNPANGWALYGLAAALRQQGRTREALGVMHQFEAAWQHADVRLPASAFWFAGADTSMCECQRASSPARAISSPANGS